jgi:hypothetical protein
VPGLQAGLFGDPLGAEGHAAQVAERLAALREQRMLLEGILSEVCLAADVVAELDLDDSWRSAAQREYSRRLHELAGDLRSAVRLVEAALDAVYGAISTLTGG